MPRFCFQGQEEERAAAVGRGSGWAGKEEQQAQEQSPREGKWTQNSEETHGRARPH